MKTLYFSLLTLFLFSCSSNDDTIDNCLEFKPAGVITVETNATADGIGQFFDVTFPVINGCGEFGSFNQTTAGNVTTIEVIAKYEGCICTQDIRFLKELYNFSQTTPGTYILKFKMEDGTYLTQMVLIE